MSDRKHFYGSDSPDSIQIYTTDVDGVGAVEVVGNLSALEDLSPDDADRIADALKLAAQHARSLLSPLDIFLAMMPRGDGAK